MTEVKWPDKKERGGRRKAGRGEGKRKGGGLREGGGFWRWGCSLVTAFVLQFTYKNTGDHNDQVQAAYQAHQLRCDTG